MRICFYLLIILFIYFKSTEPLCSFPTYPQAAKEVSTGVHILLAGHHWFKYYSKKNEQICFSATNYKYCSYEDESDTSLLFWFKQFLLFSPNRLEMVRHSPTSM